MVEKNKTKVLIGGNVYTLSGEESEEYIQRVALYINRKMDELKHSDNGQSLNSRLLNVLLALNIADELFKEKDKVTSLKDHYSSHDETVAKLEATIDSLTVEKEILEKKIESLETRLARQQQELEEYIEIFEQTP